MEELPLDCPCPVDHRGIVIAAAGIFDIKEIAAKETVGNKNEMAVKTEFAEFVATRLQSSVENDMAAIRHLDFDLYNAGLALLGRRQFLAERAARQIFDHHINTGFTG